MSVRNSSCAVVCRAALAATLASAATPARPLSWNRAVEPAPAVYASGPTRTGRTQEALAATVRQVDAYCRAALGGLPEHSGPHAYYSGCYDPRLDLVVLPNPKVWPSQREWRELREHEWAHARGWRHAADGRGTDWSASLPPVSGVRTSALGF